MRWLTVLLVATSWQGWLAPVMESKAAAQDDVRRTFDDFDSVALGDRWVALGEGTGASRIDVPADTKHEGVAGKMVSVRFPAMGGMLAMKPDIPWPELEPATAIRLRIRGSEAKPDDPEVLECRVYSGQRRAWRWIKIEISDDRWQTVDLPLRWFRHSDASHVDWSEAKRLVFFSRTAGEIQLDGIELVRDAKSTPASVPTAELQRLAFGDRGRVIERSPFVLITDVDILDEVAVGDALDRLGRQIEEELGVDPEAGAGSPAEETLVPLLIFAREEDYRTFFAVLGKTLQGQIAPPKTQGFTVFGIACCVYSDAFGPVRPIYVHEACHALLERRLGLGNRGEWLHEGLANHYQTMILGQEEERRKAERFVAMGGAPWNELLSGDPIGLERYADAMLVTEWLLDDPKRRQALVGAFKTMRDASTTKADAWMVASLGSDFETLRGEWLAWVRARATANR